MKRYEKMSKEEILNFVKGCLSRSCRECPAQAHFNEPYCSVEYLMDEIQMIPRWKTVKTQEDLNRIFEEFRVNCCLKYPCDCAGCTYDNDTGIPDCFYRNLSELIEVQE